MTDPFDDDPWKDLARDLGVEDATQIARPPAHAAAKPEEDPEAEPVGEERPARGFAHRPLEPEPAAEELPPPDIEAEAFTDAVDLDTDEGEEGDGEVAEGEAAGEEEAPPGEGQPGTGRKRRRRRRRRKKGGPAENGAEGAATADVEPVDETAAAEEGEPEPEPEPEGDEEAEEVGAGAALAAEEDTGSDVLRDIIATWNVPSWDEIVTGLYRPDR
jgi:ribonuclease E